MSVVFADTFYWIAFTNLQDAAHKRAKALGLERASIVTTEEVLIEYLNYFAAWGPNFRLKSSANVEEIMKNPMVHVVEQTPASFLTGLDLYRTRPDKGYSLTDCISMQTMRNNGLTDALTNDRHFEQEGFHVLFRE